MGCLSNFAGGNSMWWILILLLILDDGSSTCDSLVWILLLSRFCGGDCGSSTCPCGTANTARTTCGCGCN